MEVLDGKSTYQTFLTRAAVPLSHAPHEAFLFRDLHFDVGDFTSDGIPDVVCVDTTKGYKGGGFRVVVLGGKVGYGKVLDMTSRADVEPVAERLASLEVRL